MADLSNPQGILQSYFDSVGRQEAALRQPSAPQGGFLSNADPVMLSLAAGLLSPTKTGSFGESIGSGLSAVQGPLAEMRRQESARADKLSSLEQAKAKLALDWMELQQGGRRGYKPEDPSLIASRWNKQADDLENSVTMLDENDPERLRRLGFADYLRGLAENVSGYGKKGEKKAEPKDGETKAEPSDSGGIPKVSTKEEYDALPSGTQYIDPNGKMRTKSGSSAE